MSRLAVVVLCELGVVVRLHVVPHLRPLDCLLAQLAVPKVIPIGEIALIYRLALFGVRDGEEGLPDVVLALDLLIAQTGPRDAEKAGVVNLARVSG